MGIGERTQTIVVFLARSVPQSKVDGFAVHHHVGGVVVKDSGDVFTRERIGGVGDQEAGFSDSSITDDDAFDGLHGCSVVEEWRERERER